jgi:phosphatidylglycerophosphate synthase
MSDPQAEPVKRTSEIEEITNAYFIHPISSRLVPLCAALNISPNAVSIAGMGCGIMAGFAYYHYRHLPYAISGFLLMICWHVLDGTDGQLARLTHMQSETGKILDGICDYVTFTAVYVALAAALSRDHGGWIWGVAVIAGASHAVQAAAYEAQRQDYNFWGWGRPFAALAASDNVPGDRPTKRLGRLYAAVQLLATGADANGRRRLAATLAQQPERTAAIRLCYRQVFAPGVRRWSLLSANYRTLAIFLFAALKIPLAYFCFEIVVLSAILAILLAGQQARYARLFTALQAAL